MYYVTVDPQREFAIAGACKHPVQMVKLRLALESHRPKSFWPLWPLGIPPLMPLPNVLRWLVCRTQQNQCLSLHVFDRANEQ